MCLNSACSIKSFRMFENPNGMSSRPYKSFVPLPIKSSSHVYVATVKGTYQMALVHWLPLVYDLLRKKK